MAPRSGRCRGLRTVAPSRPAAVRRTDPSWRRTSRHRAARGRCRRRRAPRSGGSSPRRRGNSRTSADAVHAPFGRPAHGWVVALIVRRALTPSRGPRHEHDGPGERRQGTRCRSCAGTARRPAIEPGAQTANDVGLVLTRRRPVDQRGPASRRGARPTPRGGDDADTALASAGTTNKETHEDRIDLQRVGDAWRDTCHDLAGRAAPQLAAWSQVVVDSMMTSPPPARAGDLRDRDHRSSGDRQGRA